MCTTTSTTSSDVRRAFPQVGYEKRHETRESYRFFVNLGRTDYEVLPEAWLEPIELHSDHHIFWVIRGRATVHVGAELVEVPAWHALWIPPGSGLVSATTDTGTVALSVLVPTSRLTTAPSAVHLQRIDRSTSDALVYHYVRWVMPHWVDLARQSTIERLARAGGTTTAPGLSQPPLPVSGPAASVASALLRDPTIDTTLEEWAKSVGVSGRQLARQFTDETGVSFGRWRMGARMAHALSLIRQNLDSGEIAHALGYNSRASFNRAFRQTTGLSLTQARQHARTAAVATPEPAQEHDPGALLLNPHPGTAPGVRSPASHTLPRVNDFHVMVWMMRGTGRAELGGRVVELSEGEALWIPAGVWNIVRTDDGAVMVPIGTLPGEFLLRQHHSTPVRFGRDREAELLYRASANYTRLKPISHDRLNMRDLLPHSSRRLPASPLLKAVAAVLDDDVAQPRPLEEWARAHGVPLRALSKRFEQETGVSVRRWRRDRRMHLARLHLSRPGSRVLTVSAEVGYSHVPTFIQTFTEAHGISPREFQRRQRRIVLYDELTDG